MQFLRKLTLWLILVSPVVVAVYSFAVNHWQAGLGASVLAIFSVFFMAMAKFVAEEQGEDWRKRAREEIREEERKRLLKKVA